MTSQTSNCEFDCIRKVDGRKIGCGSPLACGTFGYCREYNFTEKRHLQPKTVECYRQHKGACYCPASTRTQFIDTYRAMLLVEPGYEWTKDTARFERFMASVKHTLTTEQNTWSIDSPVVVKAWRAIGMKGKPTYKALRALAT